MSDKQTFHQNTHCGICGMVRQGNDYHPDLACVAFSARPIDRIQEMLREVVEYGMKAQRAGLSLDLVMGDSTYLENE